MTGFAAHNITHLSASQITQFAGDASIWVAQRLLGYKSPPSFAMIRGRAVEAGVVQGLTGADLIGAVCAAHGVYDRETALSGFTGDRDKERAMIPAMVEQAIGELLPLGAPEIIGAGQQHKIELACVFGNEPDQSIPVIGYLDLVYPDRKIVVDVKTTTRVPSSMTWAHRVQRAIYARATGYTTRFLYASEKKTAWLEDGDVERMLADVKALVRRMDALLRLGDAAALRAAVPVPPDSFYWRDAPDQRRELFGL